MYEKVFPIPVVAAVFFIGMLIGSVAFARQSNQEGYLLVHEKDVVQQQPGLPDEGGNTTVYNFLSGVAEPLW